MFDWVQKATLISINCILPERYSFSEYLSLKPLSANPTKWSDTSKQFVSYYRVFNHFVELVVKGLKGLNDFQWFTVAYIMSYEVTIVTAPV